MTGSVSGTGDMALKTLKKNPVTLGSILYCEEMETKKKRNKINKEICSIL